MVSLPRLPLYIRQTRQYPHGQIRPIFLQKEPGFALDQPFLHSLGEEHAHAAGRLCLVVLLHQHHIFALHGDLLVESGAVFAPILTHALGKDPCVGMGGEDHSLPAILRADRRVVVQRRIVQLRRHPERRPQARVHPPGSHDVVRRAVVVAQQPLILAVHDVPHSLFQRRQVRRHGPHHLARPQRFVHVLASLFRIQRQIDHQVRQPVLRGPQNVRTQLVTDVEPVPLPQQHQPHAAPRIRGPPL